jgi:hypothetical protein
MQTTSWYSGGLILQKKKLFTTGVPLRAFGKTDAAALMRAQTTRNEKDAESDIEINFRSSEQSRGQVATR